MSSAPELKATLTLPQTEFPMKANLPQNEPLRLASWQQVGLYEQIRAARAGRKRYLLHDGPPYANGPIHLGHALNKCLKDFIVKSKTMAGFDAPFIPGFDCHGLPIEIKVDEQLGRKKLNMPAAEFLSACRAYAQKYIDLQTSQFVRLGILGRWDKPYATMSRPYEARTLETFYRFFEKDFVYKGLKPVYWCIHDRTALADAEIEYEKHTSPSVYVRYAMTSAPEAVDAALAGRRVNAIIWTTTPWTLPASLAVAFHPELTYVALEQDGEVYLVAEALLEPVRKACALDRATEIARFAGAKLEHSTYQHPFLERSILGVVADYVTTEQGTGAVHTAPAHGADDFMTGVRYGLDPVCNVDPEGRLRNGLPEYDGLKIFAANEPIIALLTARKALMGREDIEHSYPHCWRCHKPVIFRATEQWFIRIDTPMEDENGQPTTFRQLALHAIRNTIDWDPSWGEERIANMIATRPDWCISRQRVWGVPIAVFLCNGCHHPLQNAELYRSIVDQFREHGAQVWHEREAAEWLPTGTSCAHCGGTDFRKENDILDVWFDSGVSWNAVLDAEPGLEAPADLYFEGGDQYRGWFHTALLTSVGVSEHHGSPYRMVGTAGWTLDEQGRAMSKSLGNGVDPVDIANRMGAEIVRLWVASVDFREDVRASEALMQRVADNYRKLRNTFRFLLGNLNGFDLATDSVALDELLPLDRYLLERTRELTERVRGWYEAFEFHRIYHAVIEFCVVDLSALYLDALKDRMYTLAPKSHARRSAQTVIYTMAHALVRLVAPILSFTSDEVWPYLPADDKRPASVHLAEFPTPEEIAPKASAQFVEHWQSLLALRDEALRVLEAERKAGKIGKGLDARVRLGLHGAWHEAAQQYRASLEELLNVSQVEWVSQADPSATAEQQITAEPARGEKCNRCWRYYEAGTGESGLAEAGVGEFGPWQNVCSRCQNALTEMGLSAETGVQA